MMWHTHTAMGASSAWLLVPFLPLDASINIAVLVVFCVVGALMPDMDAVESKIKHVKVLGIKPLIPASGAINRDFGHRGLLHSLWGWAGWTLLILPFFTVTGWLSVAALSLGYMSHLIGDACTRTGIPLLYPKPKSYYTLPAWLRVVTGSISEELFFVVFSLLSLLLLMVSVFQGQGNELTVVSTRPVNRGIGTTVSSTCDTSSPASAAVLLIINAAVT